MKKLEESIRAEDRRDQAVPLSKDRITNNITRCSFINLIIRSGTATMDLLLTHKAVKNKRSIRLAVRILTMAPQDDEDFLHLKKNLLLFANLSEDENLTPSKLLNMYCQRLVKQLHQLRFVTKIDSIKLKSILGGLVRDHGWKYYFGNNKLKHQLGFWVAKDQEREELMAIPEEINTMDSWVKSRAQADTLDIEPAPAVQTEEDPGGFMDFALRLNQQQLQAQPLQEVDPEAAAQVLESLIHDQDVQHQDVQHQAAQQDEPPVSETLNQNVFVPKLTPNKYTPIKVFEGTRAKWSDKTQLQLLKLYMEKALDPFERPKIGAVGSKAIYRNNAQEGGGPVPEQPHLH